MKKIIQWLAKVFDANITVIVTVEKEVIKLASNHVEGDLHIDGHLVVTGKVEIGKGLITYSEGRVTNGSV